MRLYVAIKKEDTRPLMLLSPVPAQVVVAATVTSVSLLKHSLQTPRATFRHVPYPFPASITLTGLRAISDAPVGRRRWTDLTSSSARIA